MVDIYTSYEQKEAMEISNVLKKKGIENKIEECSGSLQAYAPAMVSYILKVDKEVEERAHEVIDELFE